MSPAIVAAFNVRSGKASGPQCEVSCSSNETRSKAGVREIQQAFAGDGRGATLPISGEYVQARAEVRSKQAAGVAVKWPWSQQTGSAVLQATPIKIVSQLLAQRKRGE